MVIKYGWCRRASSVHCSVGVSLFFCDVAHGLFQVQWKVKFHVCFSFQKKREREKTVWRHSIRTDDSNSVPDRLQSTPSSSYTHTHLCVWYTYVNICVSMRRQNRVFLYYNVTRLAFLCDFLLLFWLLKNYNQVRQRKMMWECEKPKKWCKKSHGV